MVSFNKKWCVMEYVNGMKLQKLQSFYNVDFSENSKKAQSSVKFIEATAQMLMRIP